MRLTILHFVTTSSPSEYFMNLVRFHDRSRFRMLFGTLDAGGAFHVQLHQMGIESFSLDGWSKSRAAIAAARLTGILRRERVDICQTHLVDASRVGLVAARLARVPLAILTRHHSDSVHLLGRPLPLLADRLCNRLAHRIFAGSQRVVDVLVEREGVPRGRIAQVYYGSNFDSIRPSDPGATARIRGEFNLNGDFVVGMVARLHRVKGHVYLLEAIRRLRDQGRPVRGLFVGRGPEREALEQTAARLGLGEAVTFTGYRPDLWDVMAAMDVSVLPSVSEGFNQVVVESMALRKPVVATEVANEAIRDGENGLLVPSRDVPALAGALARLMDDRALADRLGDAGYRDAQQRFSARAMVHTYEEWYGRWWQQRSR